MLRARGGQVARLFLASDILHNSTAPVRNASRYRNRLEETIPDIFQSFHVRRGSNDEVVGLIMRLYILGLHFLVVVQSSGGDIPQTRFRASTYVEVVGPKVFRPGLRTRGKQVSIPVLRWISALE